MNIFQQIKSSVYGPEYYKEVVGNMRMRSSIKYLAKLSLLIALLSIVVSIVFLPKMSKLAKEQINSIVALYPADLEVTITKGKASINQPEPYFIKGVDGKNLIVINTKEAFTVDKFQAYGTFALLSATEFVAIKDMDTGQLQVMPLPKQDGFVTKALVLKGQGWLVDALPWIFAVIIVCIGMVFFIGNFVGSLIILFIYALAVWIMSQIFKWNLSYKKSYQVGLHAMTLASILSLVTFMGVLGFMDNFFVKLLLVILVVYINLRNLITVAPVVTIPEVMPEPIKEVEVQKATV